MLKKPAKKLTKTGIKRLIEHKSADRGKFWNTIRRINQRLEETEKRKEAEI